MSQVGLPTSVCGQTAIVLVVNPVVPPAADLVGGAMALRGWGLVPPRLVKKILALEFVDMWELLPLCFKIRWLYLVHSINYLMDLINYLMHSQTICCIR